MSFPDDMALVQVSIGPPTDFAGTLLTQARVTFTPSASLIWKSTGVPMFASPIPVELDETGLGAVSLPATDQDGFIDFDGNPATGLTYRVAWSFKDKQVPAPAPYSVQLPAANAAVDLDLVAPWIPTPPAPDPVEPDPSTPAP